MSVPPLAPAVRFPSADAILILDAQHRVVYATEPAAALFGRTASELLYEPVSALLEVLPESAETWEFENLQFTTVFLGSEEASRDREAAKRMTSVRRVAAAMANEFNNVLAGIGSFAEFVQRRSADDDTRSAAAQIGKAIRRGKTVTGEILRYARSRPPTLVPIDVHSWLEGFLPEANAIVGDRVTLEISGELCTRGDPAQLNQVLVNLLTNARDAPPPDAPIVLRASTGRRDGIPMLDLGVIDRGTIGAS